MDSILKVVLIVAVLYLWKNEGGVLGAKLTKSPINITADVGDDILFECEMQVEEGEIDILEWKEHVTRLTGNRIFLSANPTKVTNPDKYGITGKYDLIVKSVQLKDAGLYSCTMLADGQPHIANLVVIDTPKLELKDTALNVQTPNTITCSANFGPDNEHTSPAHNPMVRLSIGERDLEAETVRVFDPAVVKGELVDFKFSSNENGKALICEIYTTSPEYSHKITQNLNIKYAVEPINIEPEKETYKIGETITCMANGNPEPDFRWRPMTSPCPREVTGSTLQVNAAMVGTNEWRCIATNTVLGLEVQERSVFFEVINEVADPTTTTTAKPEGTVPDTGEIAGSGTMIQASCLILAVVMFISQLV